MKADAIRRTIEQFNGTQVRLVGIRPASDLISWVGPRRYLRSGPPTPLELRDIPGPMRGALLGALVVEGEAADLEEAARIFDHGDLELGSCHAVGGVGAMAGIVTPSMPIVVVETETGTMAFSPINEGLGKALRFGSNDPATLQRLVWIRDAVAPLLDRAIATADPIDMVALQAEGLRRGDECHNRNVASTAALLIRLAPHIIREARGADDPAAVIEWASSNPHFFLPFSMATAKAIADRGHGISGSPIVTAMCGNGIHVGIRVSGLGDRWVLGPAPVGDPVLFEGYSIEDAQPTMGDSFITETVGLGAFAISASPAISSFIGSDPTRSVDYVAQMRGICAGTSTRFLLPFEGFTGSPVGIDVTRVERLQTAPLTNNGLAHRNPGIGQVGAGLTRLPIEPFLEAATLLRA